MVGAPLARRPSIFSAENFHFSPQKIGRSPIFAHFLPLFDLNGESNKFIPDFQLFLADFYTFSTFSEFFTENQFHFLLVFPVFRSFLSVQNDQFSYLQLPASSF